MSSEDNEGLIVETLFVACTRPSTVLWVPLSAVILEIIVVVEIFVFTHNLLMLALILPVHGIFYLLCLKEPRIFELIRLALITRYETLFSTGKFWKASTYSPLEIHAGCDEKRLYGKKNGVAI